MIAYKDECCDCAAPGYPCLYSECPNIHVKHLYCDKCKDEVDILYKYDDMELCEECLLGQFEKVERYVRYRMD